jgi:hypothetical protein
MRILLVGMVLGLGACASTPAPPPAETHICTESLDGLAECRLVEQES